MGFAFTILDDTDCSTLQNAPCVYDFLYDIGLRTTKSVWIFDGQVRPDNLGVVGTTCQDRVYLEWVKSLQQKGFEIASHSTSFTRSTRSQIIQGLDCFQEYFGAFPKVLAQHNDTVDNESIYWGVKRLSGLARFVYILLNALKGQKRNIYHGEIESSKYFWGDICQDRIKYVRNFVYPEINTLRACPYMPYHDTDRPYVNYWFASTEAPDLSSFVKVMSEENQIKLMNQGGACIIYTHLGKGFVHTGKVEPAFRRVMESIAAKDGWFVPVGELLDYLLQKKTSHQIRSQQRRMLEWKWLLQKLAIGTS